MASNNDNLVLITGGSGFLGAHCVIHCLNNGYPVRTTVRSLKREAEVRSMIEGGGATNLDRLSFVEADLTKDAGWEEAVKSCSYVLHVASPFPPGPPKHEDDLIIPAREGTLRVLRAARDAHVKRVVVTSSAAAIAYGHADEENIVFTEDMWTVLDDPSIGAYAKSKTLAERAAWDFIEKEGGPMELATVQPVGIYGPVLGPDFATSIQLVQRMLNGSLPGCPQLAFGVVDVRDVCDLHMRAMLDPKANGQRFLGCATPVMTIQEMSLALRDRLGDAARRAPTRLLPNFILRLVALFDPAVALFLPQLGKKSAMSVEKAKTVLGWQPRSNVDALVATAESLIRLGLVNK